MTETSAPPQPLTQDLEDQIALVRDADSVELRCAPLETCELAGN
jgi:hypothetical protein